MDKPALIKKILREIIGETPVLPISGVVVSVQGQTCTVKVASGLVVSGVRLNPTVSDSDGICLATPAEGSHIMMLSADGTMSNLAVIKMDRAEKFLFSQNGLIAEFDGSDGKVSIRNNDTSLKDLFGELKSIISELTVYTSTGPSGAPLPATQTALQDFETIYNKLLK